MAVELATAYVSLTVETSKIPGQIDRALRSSSKSADSVGSDIGNRMSSALGKTLKAGAVTAAATAGAGIATALTKGWQRLSAIDDAQGKLVALGNTSQQTAKILDNAMTAVKGTSYGFGDAASLAGTAVAAGVESGKDLTRYLSLVADAATIANVPLSEMGQIFNKVQTGGRAYTMEITQLADRGIPIWQWLQKEMGATQEELRDLVADGKVSSADYLNAIEKNIGGAATAATTVSSQWANTMAAMGRLGAKALEPTFGRLSGWLGTGIEGIDAMTDRVGPLAQALDAKVFEEWGPRVGEAFDTVMNAFDELSGSGLVVSSLTRVQDIFTSLWDSAQELGPSIGQIVEALAKASAAVGVSTWQVLLSALEAAAQVVDAVLVPAFSTVADLMEDNEIAVTALVAAFAAMKVLPAIGAAAASAFMPVRSAITTVGTATAGMRASIGAVRSDFARLAPQIGATGAAMRAFGNSSATIRNMQNAFINSSTAAGGFAGAIRAGVTPALGGLRSAATGVRNLFSGGLGIGLAVVGAMQFISAMDDMEDSQSANLQTANKLAEAQRDVGKALQESRGAINEDVFDALTQQMETYRQGLERTAAEAPGLMNDIVNFVMPKWDDDMDIGERWSAWWGGANDDLQDAGRVAEETAAAFDKIGASNRDIAEAMSGSDMQWSNFLANLRDVGGASDDAIRSLEDQRRKYEEQQEAARNLTPGIMELADSFDILADTASSASDKSDALKRTLDVLAGVPPELGDAMQSYNELVRDTAEATADAWDQSKGWADALIGTNGAVDTSTENGAKLRDSILDIKDATADVATSGGDLEATLASNEDMFRQLAESAGLSFDEIMKVAAAEGYLPEAFSLALNLDGAEGVTEGLELIRTMLEYFPDKPVQIEAEVLDEQAIATLEELGFKIRDLGNGNVEITADNALAVAALDAVLDKIHDVDIAQAVPEIGADDTAFRIIDEETKSSLENIDRTQVSPEIGAVIDQFLAGETVTLEKLAALDTSKANPEVLLQIQQALANAAVVNKAIDDAARKRTAEIAVQFAVDYGAARSANPGFVGPLSVTPRANGGIQNLPGQATIQPGRGAGLIQWAEGETGGEAFIPLAQSKRGRSTQILADVANRFGLRLEKFADGGITRALNAARSVTGNKYVWGGTGPTGFDCSGMVGWIQQIVMGMSAVEAAGRRLYTTYSLLGGSTAGLQPGAGPAGTAFVVGVSQEHMAATLAGNNIEAGGAHGTSSLNGPAVGAYDSQFSSLFHLPNSMVDGGADGVSLYGYSGYAEPVEWTEKDELDLEDARVKVLQAQEARDKTYANEKKSDADRQAADIKVQRAELKVRQLEEKRDGKGGASQIVTPAPELSGEMDADTLTIRRAEIALLDAQLARDKVYSDPESTSLDKEKADLQVFDARNSLEETKERIAEDSEEGPDATNKDGWTTETLRDRVASYGSQVAGILFDSALEIFGIESRWLDIPWPKYELESDKKKPKKGDKKKGGKDGKKDDEAIVPPPAGSFSRDDLTRQLGFNPQNGMPEWFAQHLKPLPLKVYDTGGWLKPNEMAINLSNKPEPIFNSPAQLTKFMGQNAEMLEPAMAGGTVDYSVHIVNPQFANESKMMRAARDQQERARMRNGGRPF